MWDHMWNGSGPMFWPWGLVMGFFWIVVFGIVIFFAVFMASQWQRRQIAGGPGEGPTGGGTPRPKESAREILDRRYAEGELSREEYEQMKDDLQGDEQGPEVSGPQG